MILVDANLLIYAANASAPGHVAARAWLETVLSEEKVGLPWSSLWAFVRITTNPRLMQPALTAAAAWEFVEDWLDCEAAWIPQPTERHRAVVGGLLKATGATGARVMDLALAALAIEHGLTLFTTDADFAAFPGLRWKNPVANKS